LKDTVFDWLFPVRFPMLHAEAIVSATAAALTIVANAWISHYVLPPEYQVFLAASMGASAILVMVAEAPCRSLGRYWAGQTQSRH
jgi:CBS-domain-containing membrane protein